MVGGRAPNSPPKPTHQKQRRASYNVGYLTLPKIEQANMGGF